MGRTRKNDITGQRFGKLVVLKEVEPYRDSKGNIKTSKWLCKCDCGNETIAYKNCLCSGDKLSCGCLVKNKKINLTGKQFGSLIVVKEAERRNNHRRWFCKCSCGKYVIKVQEDLLDGSSYSCGCLYKKGKHGKRNTRLYKIWDSMKQRCNNENHTRYKNYGGRGIKVCDEWNNKNDGFINFYNWAIQNGYKDNLTIDRIDVNGNYCPENCQWITNQEQQENKTTNRLLTFNGKTMCVSQWAKELGLKEATLRTRISKGWSDERVLTTPIKKRSELHESNNN